MKKLNKKVQPSNDTVMAYRCPCSCSCDSCIGASMESAMSNGYFSNNFNSMYM